MLKPREDRVLLTIEREETKSASGIILTTETEGAKTNIAKVLAIGPEVSDIKVGDKVLYDKYATLPVDKDNENVVMISAGDIFAIVED